MLRSAVRKAILQQSDSNNLTMRKSCFCSGLISYKGPAIINHVASHRVINLSGFNGVDSSVKSVWLNSHLHVLYLKYNIKTIHNLGVLNLNIVFREGFIFKKCISTHEDTCIILTRERWPQSSLFFQTILAPWK